MCYLFSLFKKKIPVYDKLDGCVSNMECVTAFTSKVLGLGIVMGSSLVKLPQVTYVRLGGGAGRGAFVHLQGANTFCGTGHIS